MASLLASLPAPAREYGRGDDVNARPSSSSDAMVASSSTPAGRQLPPYGRRKGFVPRKPEDFGAGGAFPEIHVAQYPLDMGRPGQGAGDRGGQTLALTTTADGDVSYDAILKQGRNRNKTIASDHSALVPKLDQLGEVNSGQKKSRSGITQWVVWGAVSSGTHLAPTLPAQHLHCSSSIR